MVKKTRVKGERSDPTSLQRQIGVNRNARPLGCLNQRDSDLFVQRMREKRKILQLHDGEAEPRTRSMYGKDCMCRTLPLGFANEKSLYVIFPQNTPYVYAMPRAAGLLRFGWLKGADLLRKEKSGI